MMLAITKTRILVLALGHRLTKKMWVKKPRQMTSLSLFGHTPIQGNTRHICEPGQPYQIIMMIFSRIFQKKIGVRQLTKRNLVENLY